MKPAIAPSLSRQVSPAPESLGAILAKNLVVARQAARVTQHALAVNALVSRATIAQIESGSSDPRLSTIEELARALRISPLVLVVGREDIDALVSIPDALAERPIEIPPSQLQRMQRLVESGMLKDRIRAAQIGAALAIESGRVPAAVITAAVFAAIQPLGGVALGTALGERTARG